MVLFLLSWACIRLGVYTVIVAGWSSNSGHSLLGGLRASAQTISYEVRLTGSVLILLASCQQTCMRYTIAVCTVTKTPDDGQRSFPKHIEFYSKNKFEELVHLVGFIIRVRHICCASMLATQKIHFQ